MRPLFIASAAANAFRAHVGTSAIEHGGVLIVNPEHGDILAYVAAPDDILRTAVSVRIAGETLDRSLRESLTKTPGGVFGGYAHLHPAGPEELSLGDYAELGDLHRRERDKFPALGIVMLLGVQYHGQIELRAWISRSATELEPVAIQEVVDPIAARAAAGTIAVVQPNAHVLATDEGSARFAAEIDALEAAGWTVTGDVVDHKVALRITKAGVVGALRATLPTEGWARPPRVEIESADGSPTLVTDALAGFLLAWSSAFTLLDLVDYARRRGLWGHEVGDATSDAAPARRCHILDLVVPELAGHDGVVFGTRSRFAAGERLVVASTTPSPGLVPVATVGTTRTSQGLPCLLTDDAHGARLVEPSGAHTTVETLRWSTDYAARQTGLIDAACLQGKRVVVVGAGSVGLPILLFLVKAGVPTLTVLDADRVSLENLVRSGFCLEHLGELKVTAAADLLVRANPRVRVEPHPMTFEDALVKHPDLLDGASLIVNAASNATGFALAAKAHREVPILYPGIHANGASGEIFVSGGAAHAERACFACYRAAWGGSAGHAEQRSYTTGELEREPGLGADIAHVASAAASIALGILAGKADRVVNFERPLLLVTNHHGALLGTPFETQWVEVPPESACPNHRSRARMPAAEAEKLAAAIPEVA